MPYFDTRKHTVYSPGDKKLEGLYNLLEKYAPTIGDSPLFDDLVDVYETLDFNSEVDTHKTDNR